MSNSELPTRVSSGPGRLVDALLRQPLMIVAVDPACRASLVPEGLEAGVEISIESRLAFGGPLVVRLGRARLAIARSVAARVTVEPAEAAEC